MLESQDVGRPPMVHKWDNPISDTEVSPASLGASDDDEWSGLKYARGKRFETLNTRGHDKRHRFEYRGFLRGYRSC